MIPVETAYEIEYYSKVHVAKIVKAFNAEFPEFFKDNPLPEDIVGYEIHNMGLAIAFSLKNARKAIRFSNFACMINLNVMDRTDYPAMTGSGKGRVLIAIDKDFQDPNKLALYRLDIPGKLSKAATDFDEQDDVEGFEGLQETILVSPVPSRGKKARSQMPHKPREEKKQSPVRHRDARPTIQEILRSK